MLVHQDKIISNLQTTGFSFLNESPFSKGLREEVLNYSRERLKNSNENSKAIICGECEVYLPEESSYSSVRNISRSFSLKLPRKTVVYRRHDSLDRGLFLDIINPDLQVLNLRQELFNSCIFNSLKVTSGVSESNVEFHIYYTKSCAKPRSWHIDGPSLKIFTYLTDVDIDHGPYAYQLRSQRFYDREYERQKNSKLNLKKLKATVSENNFKFEDVISPTGKEGTSFISNQAGIHRGLDQKNGMERVVLVCQFL